MTTTDSYTQDFNTLNTAGTVTWTDNATLANWYAQRTGTGTTIVANAGASNAGNLYSYGTGTNMDRALGSVGSGGAAAGSFAWGILLRNTSGGPITDIRVSYVGEQWRKENNATAQTVTFHYRISSSPNTALTPNNQATWTAVPALDFTGPIAAATPATALDGNAAANRTAISNVAIPSLSLANNEYIMLRWDDPNHAGTDHGLAIDDVLIEWTAEPSVSFASATGSAIENVGAPQTITLNIAPPFTGTGNITLSAVNGPGAIYGTDYITDPAVAAGTITIPVNGTNIASATFDLEPLDDALFEGDETVTFTITGTPAGLNIGPVAQHVFTIVDDEPFLNFTSDDLVVMEPNAGPHVFGLQFGYPADGPGTITIQVTDGPGAVYGVDYTTTPAPVAGSITLPFANNALGAQFSVTVLDDAIAEDTEVVTFTITAISGDNAIGADNERTLTIGDDDNPATILEPSDLVILGVNAGNQPCSGMSPNFDDLVSFMCFKPLTPGTELIITDNGYQRCNPGQWGNTEGAVRLVRTGPTIPAGQVVTLRIVQVTGAGNVVGVAPDADWSCTNINTPAGTFIYNPVALNANGEQLFFMQGGTWNSGQFETHDATYDGTVLFGFSTNPGYPWSATCGTGGSQRSDLPPGIECFSMAPTAASDFAKYTGPLTLASQRDWIIRVEDPANWTSYGSCATYNALAPDWLAAPILPIIPGGMVHGRWRGSTSTDWFECKNWDDARIPDATTDVVIDPTWAARNCVVGLTGPGAAECASLLQTTAGTARNLIVQDNSSLDIHGLLHMVRTAGTGPLNATVAGGSQLVADSVRLEGPAATTVLLRAQANAALLTVHGDLRILPGGCLNLQGTGEGGTLHLGGDWANAGTEAMFLHQNSTVRLNGNGPQAIHVGTGYELFNDLVIDKPAGDVTLHAPIEVIGNLDLQSGRVMNNAGELVTIRNAGAALNASHNSFVHGPVRKNGNTDFTYPVGKGNVYRPCMLSELTGNNSVAFTAEYFLASPRTTFNDVIEQPPLHHISDCEYWTIDRSFGTPDARVTLSWHDPTSCIVDELPTLRVARWDGTMWLDRGNGGTTGNFAAGTIATDAVQTAFSPWTLASLNENNPLPVELLHFDARPDGRVTDLSWATASEQGNAHFTVERSADGEQFMDLLQVAGAGYSAQLLHYAAVDAQPLPGLSFYRLRQTDLDGTATWSRTVPVHFSGTGGLAVHADAELLTVFHAHLPGTRYELRDMTGRLLMHGTVAQAGLMHLPAHTLPPGAYMLRMVHGAGAESVRFVK